MVQDSFGREINYMRISVTDLCNLRCMYCMPEDGVEKKNHADILRVDEIGEIVRQAVRAGIHKIRLTGGEPLVRKGIVDICHVIKEVPGVEELCITTNGLLLKEYAWKLKEAGVSRINISLDTLKNDKYKKITRTEIENPVDRIFAGVHECIKAGFDNIKFNTVLINGFNDDEVRDMAELTRDDNFHVRFIELMPIGEARKMDKKSFIPSAWVIEQIPELQYEKQLGVATMFKIPGYKGRIGIISSMSNHYCPTCNRLRVTADGRLKACLHSSEETVVKDLKGERLYNTICNVIGNKPEKFDLGIDHPSASLRNMNRIGG